MNLVQQKAPEEKQSPYAAVCTAAGITMTKTEPWEKFWIRETRDKNFWILKWKEQKDVNQNNSLVLWLWNPPCRGPLKYLPKRHDVENQLNALIKNGKITNTTRFLYRIWKKKKNTTFLHSRLGVCEPATQLLWTNKFIWRWRLIFVGHQRIWRLEFWDCFQIFRILVRPLRKALRNWNFPVLFTAPYWVRRRKTE